MVVTLGPEKFYGSSLPPRFFNDGTLNSEPVDPPVSVMHHLLSWAREAHWSMGGLSTNRLRFQGRIEGNVNRLRKFREKQAKQNKDRVTKGDEHSDGSVSPPPAPRVTKKRKFVDLFEDEEGEEMGAKWPARKLVAKETEAKKKVAESESVQRRTRSSNGIGDSEMKIAEEGSEGKKTKLKKRLRKVGEARSVRSSPRLAKENSVEI
ncbi:hypothetical protein LINGRAHAP2_LOCUS28906 [Linum grandiflorum]